MSAGRVYDAKPVIQVLGPGLAYEARVVTFQSLPSNSTLIYTVQEANYKQNQGRALLDSLSDAVENELSAGVAVAADGSQGLDEAGLIFDAVTFTVEYQPSYPIPGTIQGDVQVDVRNITADTQFGSFIQGGSAADAINAEYQRLKALAGE